MSDARDWITFWDSPHSIYVNARHFDVHYRDVADGICRLLPREGLRVLDYGCGEAVHADRIAAKAGKLYLCDSAAGVRARLAQRFAGNAAIAVVAPDDMAGMADGSLDMVVANSVVQYLSSDQLDRLLTLMRRLIAPGGIFIVADVIPPDSSPLRDAMALLRYAAVHGFLIAAVAGLIRTVFSDYRAVRSHLGIACYSEAEFMARLSAAGFTPQRLADNLEHNPTRMSFRAR
jgi:ubiquinone/menaquinone biosynthesis C-methylase UbiE